MRGGTAGYAILTEQATGLEHAAKAAAWDALKEQISGLYRIVTRMGVQVFFSETQTPLTMESESLQSPAVSKAEGDLAAPTPATEELNRLASILMVDDEPVTCKIVCKHLADAGYPNCTFLSHADQAMPRIVKDRPDLLLLDVVMPDIGGLEILHALREHKELKHIPVLIFTAASDDTTKCTALELGATDFLSKPVSQSELLARVRNAPMLKQRHDQLIAYAQTLEQRVMERTEELSRTRLEVVHCLGRAAEHRDTDTGSHVVRVGQFSALLARQLGCDPRWVELLEHAAPLHDVGKIGIPDEILLKPGRLTPDEMDLMQRHAIIGKQVLGVESKNDVQLWHNDTHGCQNTGRSQL